jgi:hypothetical protein
VSVLNVASLHDSEIRDHCDCPHLAIETVGQAMDEIPDHELVIWIFRGVEYLDGGGLFHDDPGLFEAIFAWNRLPRFLNEGLRSRPSPCLP